MSEPRTTITVKGLGSVPAEFTSVAYKATVKGRGATSAKAKDAIYSKKAALIALITQECNRADIDKTRLKTTLSIEEYGKQDEYRRSLTVEGYEVVFNISFTGKNLEAAAFLHDCMTSIEGVTSPSPQFLVESDSTLQDAAFKAACAHAKRLFEAQCLALELSPEDFEVVTWQTHDPERPHGKSFSVSTEQSGIDKLRPGQADHKIEVFITYAKKSNH